MYLLVNGTLASGCDMRYVGTLYSWLLRIFGSSYVTLISAICGSRHF
jgi:hypothetical protein